MLPTFAATWLSCDRAPPPSPRFTRLVTTNPRVLIDVLSEAAIAMPWPESEIEQRLRDWALQAVPSDIAIDIVPAPPPDLCVPFGDKRYLVARRAFGGTPFTDQDLRLLNALTTMAATSRQHAQREARLRRQALTDDLTGLWNHGFFRELFESANRDRDPHERIGILFLDVDRFKQLNEHLGHLDADDVLREIARRLSGALSDDCIVARVGGDEFAVVVRHVRDSAHLDQTVGNIHTAVRAPMPVRTRLLTIEVSIGAAYSADAQDDPDVLLRAAERAMRLNKRARPATTALRWYDERTMLREMLDQQLVEVAYQPIVGATDRTIRGVEALVRGRHLEFGPVSPLMLVGSASRLRLLDELTEIVVQESIETAAMLSDQAAREVTLSVNIEFEQLRQDSRLLKSLPDRLQNTGVHLVLEVSERQVGRFSSAHELVAGELHDAGIELAMDDFGAGFSTFALLNSWAWYWVKIDQSLVSGASRAPGRDKQQEKLLGHVTRMLGDLDLTSVAEGVETQEQLDLVRSLGVDLTQGFYLAPPMSSEDLLARVAEHGLVLPPSR